MSKKYQPLEPTDPITMDDLTKFKYHYDRQVKHMIFCVDRHYHRVTLTLAILICVAIISFGYIYQKQQDKIESLEQRITSISKEVNENDT